VNRESGSRVSGKRAEGGQDEGEGYAGAVEALKFTIVYLLFTIDYCTRFKLPDRSRGQSS